MSVDDAIKFYSILVQKVFSEPKLFSDTNFRASSLEAVLKDLVKERTGYSETMMLERGDSVCKT